MVLLGFTPTSGHFLFTVAYQYAPASFIAHANHMHLVWAALLSWVFFRHLPDQWTLLGILMIVIAGTGIAINTHLDKNASTSLNVYSSEDLYSSKIMILLVKINFINPL